MNHGISYKKRVFEINAIYEREARRGLPNRVIYRRFIYPVYGISERSFYNILKAEINPHNTLSENEARQLYLFSDSDFI